MSLQIIGAGFGRTGTLSMKAALEQLGYHKTHHMLEVAPNAFQVDSWHAISQGGTPDWDSLFAGYQACVDFPASVYWRELAEHYPDAKIILTTRSFDGWYSSASETIYAVGGLMTGWLNWIPRVRKLREMVFSSIWDRVFHGQFENKDHTRRVFEQHEADVIAAFPADRLLVFQPQQGWQPLCEFLEKPVPSQPFPNVNDKAEFKQRLVVLKHLGALPLYLLAIGMAVALFFGMTG